MSSGGFCGRYSFLKSHFCCLILSFSRYFPYPPGFYCWKFGISDCCSGRCFPRYSHFFSCSIHEAQQNYPLVSFINTTFHSNSSPPDNCHEFPGISLIIPTGKSGVKSKYWEAGAGGGSKWGPKFGLSGERIPLSAPNCVRDKTWNLFLLVPAHSWFSPPQKFSFRRETVEKRVGNSLWKWNWIWKRLFFSSLLLFPFSCFSGMPLDLVLASWEFPFFFFGKLQMFSGIRVSKFQLEGWE